MSDNTPTHEHRRQRDLLLYGTHFDLVDDGLALCLDATKVLREVRITDEMIERAAFVLCANSGFECSEEADENAEKSCLLHRQEIEVPLRAALEVPE